MDKSRHPASLSTVSPTLARWLVLPEREGPLTAFAKDGGHMAPPTVRFKIDPALLKRLIAGLLYSHKLISTYYITLGILLLTLTIRHWLPRLLNRRSSPPRRHEARGLLKDRQPSSYASITTESGQSNEIDDSHRNVLVRVTAGLTRKARAGLCRLRAWLLYQPRPIPVANKVLPPNETSLAALILIGINIFYTTYNLDFELKLIFVTSSRCGLVFVANLPLLYILSAKNQPLKFLTGHSYESLNIYHRRLGEYMCLMGFLHSIGMFIGYLVLRNPRDFTFWDFISNKVILVGIGAFICYDVLYATSLASFRIAWYELFLALHIVLQIAALVLLFFHFAGARVYIGIAIAIFSVDRLIFRLWLKSSTHEATSTLHPDQDTITLTIKLPVSTKKRRIRSLVRGIRASWQPAEHVFISLPAIGGTHTLQAHPFTIASPAPRSTESSADLQLLIRAQDGFSRELLQHAQQHSLLKVRVDGPYGTSSALDLLRDGDTRILVAGGSGIAVVWPLLLAMLAEDENESAADATKDHELESQTRYVLIWVVRESEHVHWLGSDALDKVKSAGVQVMLSITDVDGRPNLHKHIDNAVSDGGDHRRYRTVCSGPDGLNRAVRDACSASVANGIDMDIEVHKYGW
jgi:NAD(P)H-flavin reductase